MTVTYSGTLEHKAAEELVSPCVSGVGNMQFQALQRAKKTGYALRDGEWWQ